MVTNNFESLENIQLIRTRRYVSMCEDKFVLIIGSLEIGLVDTEESISLSKASFNPITVLWGRKVHEYLIITWLITVSPESRNL